VFTKGKEYYLPQGSEAGKSLMLELYKFGQDSIARKKERLNSR
jgi:hypothetical protein